MISQITIRSALPLVLAALSLFSGMIPTLFANEPADPRKAVDRKLLYLDNARKQSIRVGHVVEGVGVLGGTGSGKTSGPDQSIIKSEMLDRGPNDPGFGMLCTAPKSTTAAEIAEWAYDTGREKDVVIVDQSGKYVFNPLDWIAKHAAGPAVIQESVNLLSEIGEVTQRGKMRDAGGESKFFTMNGERLSHGVMVVDYYGNGSIVPKRCLQMIQQIPESVAAAQTGRGLVVETCQRALNKCTKDQLAEVRVATDFLTLEMAGMEPRVKSNIIISTTVMWSVFTPPMDRMFTGESNITPEAINDAIIVIDVPLSKGNVAKTAFMPWKWCTERYLLSRIGQPNLRPATIFLAEGSNYVSSSDYAFVSMARESLSSYHYSGQSISQLLSEIPENHVNALLSCLNLRLYCQSDCPITCAHASADLGEHDVMVPSMSGKTADTALHPFTSRRTSPKGPLLQDSTTTLSMQRKPAFPPEDFMRLRRGGGKEALVESVVRILGQYGMEGHKVFFDQNVGKKKRGWLDRLRVGGDVVTIA